MHEAIRMGLKPISIRRENNLPIARRDRVFPEPLPVAVATLQRYSKLSHLLDNLPDTTHLIDG